ncbi:MAG TPA: ABC transporter substrate-binding protein [Candidatus Latescibacteria bacterium]|nr:ABC transporter substrate-binding protein [Candidatus Latescibacterota bacterium]
MERRDFLKKAGAGTAVAAGTLAAPAIASQSREMTIVSTWPRDFPGLGISAQRLAARITELSEGRIKTTYYAAGEKVGAFDSFDDVVSGNSQAYIAADYYWKGKHPGFAFFTSVPFGMTQVEWNAWIKFKGGQALWDEMSGEFGLKALACGATGTQMGGWFNKEINGVDDFKGLKMRMPGLGGEVIKAAGATVVNLPGGELLAAMQTGAIDAMEWVGPYNDLAFGIYKVAKYYYYPGWHEPGGLLELTINKSAFNSLPPDLQEIVRSAAAKSNQWILSEFESQNHAALKELVDEHDVQLRRFADGVIGKLKQFTDEVITELAASDPMSRKVYDSYSAFQDNVTSWAELSEKQYYQAISS